MEGEQGCKLPNKSEDNAKDGGGRTKLINKSINRERDEGRTKVRISRAKLGERHRMAMEPGTSNNEGSIDNRDSQTKNQDQL